MGNSTREISDWMEENLGNRVSADTISSITERVLPEIKAWKSRMLDSVYPNTAVQLCVVHQIRNSIKYVGSKNQKEFLRDLKCVYQAVNKKSAENELLKLDEKWGEQYPVVIRSWQDNWL